MRSLFCRNDEEEVPEKKIHPSSIMVMRAKHDLTQQPKARI